MQGKLFDSMISVRPERTGGEPHLGLGLYVARLIAEFHGGAIRAENLSSGSGVAVTATFRLA
jgi:signal transduction histidine kinase